MKSHLPYSILNVGVIARDQFVQYMSDNVLHQELKQVIKHQPASTLLEVRGKAFHWKKQGMPDGTRCLSQLVPVLSGI